MLDKDGNKDSTHIRHKPFSLWISTMLTMCLRWLFKRWDSVSFNLRSKDGEENLRGELFGPPSNLCSISRPRLREETHNERDISCNCVEYDPLSHVQHVTGLNGHFTQWAHETNQTSDHPHLRELHSNYHLRLTRSRLLQGDGNRFFI